VGKYKNYSYSLNYNTQGVPNKLLRLRVFTYFFAKKTHYNRGMKKNQENAYYLKETNKQKSILFF